MEIRPILSALLRNRTGAILVGLQIALTLALVANALHIIQQRVDKMNRPTGIDTANVLYVQSYGYSPSYDHKATVTRDLDALRRLPGVVAASTIGGIPLSGSGSANAYRAKNDPAAPTINGNWFDVGPSGLDALGVKLVEGRAFREDEMTWDTGANAFPKSIIVTRELATKIFGTDRQIVGRVIYSLNGEPAEVVGVVDYMFGSWVDNPASTQVAFHPTYGPAPLIRYVIRAKPGERDRVLQAVQKLLGAPGSGRFVTWARTQDEFVERSYRGDRRMVTFLTTLIALMIGVTALGIVGLATFHVNARRKQIGTRRAVGARRIDIVRYFLVENGLLATAGVAIGGALAYGFSWWLTTEFQLPPLGVGYVVATAVALVVVGQLAVLWPARRAAAIPPAVATRTV
jgi:putative ABC transport system permease protein